MKVFDNISSFILREVSEKEAITILMALKVASAQYQRDAELSKDYPTVERQFLSQAKDCDQLIETLQPFIS